MGDKEATKTILLIIDPQKDFHDTYLVNNSYKYAATLPVKNSTENAKEIAKMIKDHVTDIDEIYITLDTHHANHIGHASFWENKNKEKYKAWIDRDFVDKKNGKEEKTYPGWCKDFIDKITNTNNELVSKEDADKKFRYGLLLEGEKTKDQKIDYLKEILDGDKARAAQLEKEILEVPTKSIWLGMLNKKLEGKDEAGKKKVYQDEIESIKKERLEPDAFANIDCDMIRKEVWVPKDESLYDYAIYYTSELEKKKRFIHTIWPPHCLIGTEGHSVEDKIAEACDFWTKVTLRPVKYEYKGMNLLTENFSAIEAEVPIASDPTTQKNVDLLKRLREKCKYLIIVGQARSHCVRYTVEHIVADWLENVWKGKDQVPKDQLPQIIVPTDGSSCVAPPDAPLAFEDATAEFITTMKTKTNSKCVVDLNDKDPLKCSEVFNYINKKREDDQKS